MSSSEAQKYATGIQNTDNTSNTNHDKEVEFYNPDDWEHQNDKRKSDERNSDKRNSSKDKNLASNSPLFPMENMAWAKPNKLPKRKEKALQKAMESILPKIDTHYMRIALENNLIQKH